jgi:two-component system, OmpR family, phosphate regulon sensor histidine kinase PhoR
LAVLTIWIVGLLILLAVALAWGAWCWRELGRLRKEVGRMAKAEPDPATPSRGIVAPIYADLRQIADRQQETFRQMADEDFNLRAILSSMDEGVLIADNAFRIRLTNDRLQEMFSIPRLPLGRTVLEVFRNHLLQELTLKTLKSGEAQSEELQIEVHDGESFLQKHFQVTSVSLHSHDSDTPSGALLVFHDVTQIRSLESVRREFVANVSHELRTPLSIITGYLETLIDGGEDPETKDRFLRIMHKHAQRLNLLIEDLLVLSQLESSKLGLHLEEVNLREAADRVRERLSSRIEGTGASVKIEMPSDLPSVEADPLRIEQVLFNLVDNALKYGAKSGLLVTLSASISGADITIEVRDNGPGIPLSDQPHIFERFYRVHKDRSRDAGGTGLGLSIVKHTVLAHGGSVLMESRPGNGSVFTVRLPLRRAE